MKYHNRQMNIKFTAPEQVWGLSDYKETSCLFNQGDFDVK